MSFYKIEVFYMVFESTRAMLEESPAFAENILEFLRRDMKVAGVTPLEVHIDKNGDKACFPYFAHSGDELMRIVGDLENSFKFPNHLIVVSQPKRIDKKIRGF